MNDKSGTSILQNHQLKILNNNHKDMETHEYISYLREAPLSLRDPSDALFQLKCWPTVVQIMQTDLMSA